MAARATHLWIEMCLLYAGIPLLLALMSPQAPVFPALWIAAIACGAWMRRRSSGATPTPSIPPMAHLMRMVMRWVIAVLALTGLLAAYHPELLFALPRRHPHLSLAILLCYPIVSVWPQGIVYRTFFFQRYGALFSDQRLAIACAALLFALGHAVFRNPWAVMWAFVGGLLFSHTYAVTGRARWADVEHTLYGLAVFTIGWGAWFVRGTAAFAHLLLETGPHRPGLAPLRLFTGGLPAP